MTRAIGRFSSRSLVWAALTVGSVASSTVVTACNLSEKASDTSTITTDGSSPLVTAGPQANVDVERVVQGSYIWQTLPIGAGGFVTGIVAAAAPQSAMYVRTDVGGAYRWDPASESWTQLLNASSLPGARPGDVVSVDSIAVAPSLGTRVYLALGNDENPAPDTPLIGGGRILVSDDGGSTWRTSAPSASSANRRGRSPSRTL